MLRNADNELSAPPLDSSRIASMGRPVGCATRTGMFVACGLTSACGFTPVRHPGENRGPENAACETTWIPASAGMTGKKKRLTNGNAEAL